MKRKLFILGYTGYYNLGDDLMIDLLAEERIPGFKILILSRRRYYRKKINYINRYNLLRYFFSISKGDILLNLGGIFQDKTGFPSFFYYFAMNLIFLLRKGKIIFLNTEFLDVQYNNKFIYFLLNRSQLTVLRSKKEYKKYSKRFQNVYYCPDMVFIYQFEKLEKNQGENSYILISLRENCSIKQFLERLKQSGYKFKFLLMNNENKLRLWITKYFPENDIFVYNYFNRNRICDLLYNTERIITMRYHVGILGLLFNKKVGVIGLNNKMRILSQDFRLLYINGKRITDGLLKERNSYFPPSQQRKYEIFPTSDFFQKKIIDKSNKNRYINKVQIEKLWKDFFNKIREI